MNAVEISLAEKIIPIIIEGNIDEAYKLLGGDDRTKSSSDVITINFSRVPNEPQLLMAKYIYAMPNDDLSMDNQKKKIVSSILAYSILHGLTEKDCATIVLKLTEGEFDCPDLVSYLRTKPRGGFVRKRSINDTNDLAEIYSLTKIFEVRSTFHLREIVGIKSVTGIRIMKVPDDHCGKCKKIEKLYKRELFLSIPKLPFHWGCRCDYQAVFNISS